MKQLFSFSLIFLLFTVIMAKTTIKCPPPSDVRALTRHHGAQLLWNYQIPDTVLSYNNGYPSGVWNPGENHALGVVFDLSAFSGATLEKVDFVHFSREKLAGPYLYNLHILDMDNSTILTVIDSLTAGDSYDTPGYEIGVSLDSIAAPAHVGIFVEGLSTITESGKVYSFPALMSDTSTYVEGVNFYCVNADDPFDSTNANYTNIYDAKLVSSYTTTNFILDLWINYEGYSTRMNSATLAKSTVVPLADPYRLPRQENSILLPGNYKTLKQVSLNPVEFKIFMGSVADSLTFVQAVPGNQFYYNFTSVAEQGSYYFGVSAVNESAVSPIEKVYYTHPKILSITEARVDENADFIPDSLGKEVWLEGVVNSPNFSETGAYYIQDAQAGLLLNCQNAGLNLQIGDSILAHGYVQQEMGLTTLDLIAAEEIDVYGAATGGIDTLKLNILDESEEYEGRLVVLENVSIVNPNSWPAQGADGLLQVTDGNNNQLQMFIDKESDLDGWTPPQGNMNLVGILSQSTETVPAFDGYRIVPRFQSDFITVVGMDERQVSSPLSFALHQNYPNPFGASQHLRGNPETVISYRLSAADHVRLSVYNALGQEVAQLINKRQGSGAYQVKFDGINLPSGVYFYQLKAGTFVQTRKMLLLH